MNSFRALPIGPTALLAVRACRDQPRRRWTRVAHIDPRFGAVTVNYELFDDESSKARITPIVNSQVLP